ncbi:thioredoxin reductase (NADPH) [Rhodoferax ferrireducens]|uniref:Ferredoxin--NADP reductase n=1 Tax=Rhodoferax ferrireducens TaxID=192843 RepID=A0ABU2C9T4_9BURK|nr:NAD(P)/FAD-dependent oxidoreductase [Rhodoferax ferrireducens]MDR7378100.1 thioredoxin reductase (NADPH) [Rhodoferax ferrireducens]
MLPVLETGAVVIGAGPVGLFQVFQLGLLEVPTHVIDALPHAGGQCMELYPDKPIYDIPGTPATSGRALAASLLQQIQPFGALFHLGQLVSSIAKQADGRFLVSTDRGTQLLAPVVVIAAGVGAFQPRRLKLDGIDAFEGSQLYYHQAPKEVTGQHLLVMGGDEAALRCALALAETDAHSVTLLHRRDVLQAPTADIVEMQMLVQAGRMRFMVGQIAGFEADAGQLQALQISDVDAALHRLPVDAISVFQGLSPKLGPVADWGLAMERKQLQVDTARFETSEPGIFAVGDINTYPGKQKLIVCGFHEATLAAYAAAPLVFPGKKIPFQYTTTSPRLHQLLGVAKADDAA